MESPDRRSESTMSLKRLVLIVMAFFVVMGVVAVMLNRHLSGREGATAPDPKSQEFAVSMPWSEKETEKRSILDMDPEHVKKFFDVIFEEISKGKEAWEDIVNLMVEYRSRVGRKTRAFIDAMLEFLESSGGPESKNIRVLKALYGLGIKYFFKKK